MSNQLLVVRSGLTLLRDLDTPKSLAISLIVKYELWDQLASLEPMPEHYNDAYAFRRDAHAFSFFKKLAIDVGLNPSTVALQKWRECEEHCKHSNGLLGEYTGSGSILHGAKRIIARILGPLDDTSFEKIKDLCRHGPGASVGARGCKAHPHRKMGVNPTVTPSAIHLVRFFSDHMWLRSIHEDKRSFTVTPGNELVFVPKDMRTDRPIAIEPMFNMYVQLGVGGYIRRRLRRVGIDLKNGQDRHRILAEQSSKSGDLATIDLSSASDTISYELVRELLPPKWFTLLDALRSPKTLVDGEWIELEKFSSMGNGFTFELETLIFYALGRSQSEFITVYGDDIIVPTSDFPFVKAILEFSGLILNTKKSYNETYFRESCGGDYFDGLPVRGVYAKSEPTTVFEKVQLANQLYANYYSDPSFYWLYYRNARNVVLRSIPKRDLLFGPREIGSNVIHDDNPDKYEWTFKDSIRYIKGYQLKSKKTTFKTCKPLVQLAMALSGYSSSGFIVRNTRTTLRTRRYAYS